MVFFLPLPLLAFISYSIHNDMVDARTCEAAVTHYHLL
jgi:hypothetical protein